MYYNKLRKIFNFSLNKYQTIATMVAIVFIGIIGYFLFIPIKIGGKEAVEIRVMPGDSLSSVAKCFRR